MLSRTRNSTLSNKRAIDLLSVRLCCITLTMMPGSTIRITNHFTISCRFSDICLSSESNVCRISFITSTLSSGFTAWPAAFICWMIDANIIKSSGVRCCAQIPKMCCRLTACCWALRCSSAAYDCLLNALITRSKKDSCCLADSADSSSTSLNTDCRIPASEMVLENLSRYSENR